MKSPQARLTWMSAFAVFVWGPSCSESGSAPSTSSGETADGGSPMATDAGSQPISASNGIKDGTETDRDCGGGSAPTCKTGQRCKAAGDCTSRVCVGGVCQAASGSDGIKNGDETDVDCGGSTQVACVPGKGCVTAQDCTSSCSNMKCDTPSDHDLKRNNGETDVDCGGANAKKCGVGKTCAAASDCGLNTCANAICATPSSADGKKNGTETDVDCGGAAVTFDGVTVAAAPKCALTKACATDPDCGSAVCSDAKTCTETTSCRAIHGGQTCGVGEFGVTGSVHESCCKSLPVPGVTLALNGVTKNVVLDKYEITAGRVRAWISAIKAQYGGIPNIQEWVRQRRLNDSVLADMIPESVLGYLPAKASDQPITDAAGAVVMFSVYPPFTTTIGHEFYGQTKTAINAGLWSQLGPTSYYRGVSNAGTSGCSMNAGGYGHRTYYIDETTEPGFAAYFGNFEAARPASRKNDLDEKSMNCMTPLMFAAFCAWDGGYVQSRAALQAAYGIERWPWGATPAWGNYLDASIATERQFPGNFNYLVNGTPFSGTRRPAYNYPDLGDGSWSVDFSPLIAAPGRFPGDIARISRPAPAESWMDLGGNMIEWSTVAGGAYFGWTGGSWEGHIYPRLWTSPLDRLDKYGKGGSRCMRLQ
jgi:hypothetical protein